MALSSTLRLPTTIAAVDEEWLTSALRECGALAGHERVTAVTAERIALETGFSSELYRIALRGHGPLPPSVVVKLPTTTAVRGAMDLVGGYGREVTFYEAVAGRAPLRTPKVFASRMASDSSDFVLVLEDLGSWENADHLAGLPLERARACIRELASLHAWSVRPENAGVVRLFPTLDGPVARQVFPALFAEGWEVYRHQARTPIPRAVGSFAERFATHATTALAALGEREALIHGDIRADNLFFKDGRMAVVDFQLAARAAGPADIGYLVSQGLTTAERRGQDETLVRDYLEGLEEHGADDCSFDEAWRQYRFAVALFLMFPVFALRGWDLLPERSRELCLCLIERGMATIEEIDALEVFS